LDRFQIAASKVDSGIARRVGFAILKAGSISWGRYVELCGNRRTADLLMKENIFVEDAAYRTRFENMILESAIQEDIARGKY